MSANPLHDSPILVSGRNMPPDDHAVSIVLATVEDTIALERGTLKDVHGGYPRFFDHIFYRVLRDEFMRVAGINGAADLFTSLKAAQACVAEVDKKAEIRETKNGLYAVILSDQDLAPSLKKFKQNTGHIVSSRRAYDVMNNIAPHEAAEVARAEMEIKKRLAVLSQTNPEDIFLYENGMAGMFHVHQTLMQPYLDKDNNWTAQSIQFGYPYVDNMDVQMNFGNGTYVKYNGPEDFKALEEALKAGPVGAVFCEVPSNPLLHTIDLQRLRELLDKYGSPPLIIDDTISMSSNIDLQQYADILVTSLTKSFSGGGNVMGGGVIVTERGKARGLKQQLGETYEKRTYGSDILVLEKNSRDVEERVRLMNENGLALAEYFQSKIGQGVAQVFHPSVTDREIYDRLKKPGAGYGGLLSIVLEEPTRLMNEYRDIEELFESLPRTRAFYNNYPGWKGPSLGNDFTMVCMYALLAHFGELRMAEKQGGVAPHIMRVSAGTEKRDVMLGRVDESMHYTMAA